MLANNSDEETSCIFRGSCDFLRMYASCACIICPHFLNIFEYDVVVWKTPNSSRPHSLHSLRPYLQWFPYSPPAPYLQWPPRARGITSQWRSAVPIPHPPHACSTDQTPHSQPPTSFLDSLIKGNVSFRLRQFV